MTPSPQPIHKIRSETSAAKIADGQSSRKKTYNIYKSVKNSKNNKYKETKEEIKYNDRAEEQEAIATEIQSGEEFNRRYGLIKFK